MRHFLSTQDHSRDALNDLLYRARGYQRAKPGQEFAGQCLGLVTLTRGAPSHSALAYAHVAVAQMGGRLVQAAGPAVHGPLLYKTDDGVAGGDVAMRLLEHVQDAADRLSRQFPILLLDAHVGPDVAYPETVDALVGAFAQASRVPVIVLDGCQAPCQSLAMMMSVLARVGSSDGRTFVLAWTPHPAPVSAAPANAAIVMAATFGFDIRLLAPENAYVLDNVVMDFATDEADINMRSLSVTSDVEGAYDGADVIYATSWGAAGYAGEWEAERQLRQSIGAEQFMLTGEHLRRGNRPVVSHSGGFLRDVDLASAVIGAADFVAGDEAANRAPALQAILREAQQG